MLDDLVALVTILSGNIARRTSEVSCLSFAA